MVLRGPAIDEESSWDQKAAWDHERCSIFRLTNAVVSMLETAVKFIVERCADLSAEEEAYAERNIVQTADADAFMITCFPQSRESGKDEVHESVEISHVDCQDLDYRLGTEKSEWTDETAFQGIGQAAFRMFKFSMQCRISGLFA